MKKISITDIARECRVSKTLVSMVLNGRGDKYGISKKTQERVLAYAGRLNYQPNHLARGFRLGRSNTIGLVVADISNPFYAKIARGVEDHASKAGYNLIICSSDESPDKETALIRVLRERQVDGLLISSTFSSSKEIHSLIREDFPFVLIDRYFPHTDTNYVIVDNYRGAFTATEHLIKLGYKRIAHMTVTPAHVTSLKERKRGFMDAMKKHELRLNKKYISLIPYSDIKQNVYRELRELLASPNNIQAIFLANNNIAVSFLECVNEMKLRIPYEIAIICFDDIELFRVIHPTVTCIAQPMEEICKAAVRTLIRNISKPDKSGKKTKIILQPELIIRESCGSLYRKNFPK